MPFVVIKGTFHVVGYSPDGDSVKFEANSAGNWSKLADHKVKKNKKGHVQLRFEAVDALETHYQGEHQPTKLAYGATDYTLGALGIKNVEWGPKHGRVTSADDGVDGFILSRSVERFGRPVSFVFYGRTKLRDGSEVYLRAPLMWQSVNYELLSAGLVYPTYYKGLFADLRGVMSAAAKDARSKAKGVWASDKTSGVTVSNLKSITDDHVILPKLFRRLVGYLKTHASVTGFRQHIENHPEGVLVLPEGNFTHFDTVIRQNGKVVGLTVDPENLVFRP